MPPAQIATTDRQPVIDPAPAITVNMSERDGTMYASRAVYEAAGIGPEDVAGQTWVYGVPGTAAATILST